MRARRMSLMMTGVLCPRFEKVDVAVPGCGRRPMKGLVCLFLLSVVMQCQGLLVLRCWMKQSSAARSPCGMRDTSPVGT